MFYVMRVLNGRKKPSKICKSNSTLMNRSMINCTAVNYKVFMPLKTSHMLRNQYRLLVTMLRLS